MRMGLYKKMATPARWLRVDSSQVLPKPAKYFPEHQELPRKAPIPVLIYILLFSC